MGKGGEGKGGEGKGKREKGKGEGGKYLSCAVMLLCLDSVSWIWCLREAILASRDAWVVFNISGYLGGKREGKKG